MKTTLPVFGALSLAMLIGSSAQAATKPTVKTVTKTPVKVAVKTTAKKTPAKTTSKTTTKTVETTSVEIPAANSNTGSVLTPITTEPTVSTVTYPKAATLTIQGTDLKAQGLTNITTPDLTISDVNFLPTVMIPSTTNNSGNLDVSIVDDFIATSMPMARHYPPVFPNKSVRYFTTQRLKQLTAWMETYARNPNASYDVLLRAAKLNLMGRNLDLGSDYAVRAGDYIARAIKQKDTGEANFLYGMMLAEGGGFTEGEKYLDKAAKMGYAEAYQSMAQSDLLNDKKDRALQRLNEFKAKYPNDPYIDRQLAIVNSGKYYIWDLPATTTTP